MHFKCIFKLLTGFDCPFCGAQRAIYDILKGDVVTAFYHNPFLFIMSPYILMVILCIIGVIPEGSRLRAIIYHKKLIILLGILTISWGIARNIWF